MKKLLLLICAILIIGNANAQEKKTEKEYKWSVGVQVNTPERIPKLQEQTEGATWWIFGDDEFLYHGLSFNAITKDKTFAASTVVNYYYKTNNFLRFRVGLDKVDIELLPDKAVELTGTFLNYNHAWKKRNDFTSEIGIGYNIEIKPLHFYVGLDIPFTYYGKTQVYLFQQVNDAITGAPISSNEQSGSIFSAFSTGIGNFAGFAFKFKDFALGGEISYALLYNKRLSETTFHAENINLQTNTIVNTTDITYNPTISNFDISKIKGSITLTYSF
jgi:hypothetical protein